MRITGGSLKGLRLVAPKGPPIRTTLDHVRQAIFNLLRVRVDGSRVLDLFSGSGALGLEAFSRGASHVTFVDRSFFSIQAIQANLQALSLATSDKPAPASTPGGPGRLATVLRADAVTAIRHLRRKEEVFDLVLLDPPYGHHLARKSLNALAQYAIVSLAGLVIAECDKRDPLPPQIEGKESRFVLQRRERYGDTALILYETVGG